MKGTTLTKLPHPIQRELLIGSVRVHARMMKNGFTMNGTKPINYGIQILFTLKGHFGMLRIFKNNKDRTTFDYSGVYEDWIISLIRNIIQPLLFFNGEIKEVIPSKVKRWKAKSYRENLLRIPPSAIID